MKTCLKISSLRDLSNDKIKIEIKITRANIIFKNVLQLLEDIFLYNI